MKRLIFTFNRNKSARYKRSFDFKYFIRRYGSVVFFALILICGLTIGSLMCNEFNESTLSKLDFLFSTNISGRLENGVQGAFSASLASNFLFLLLSFLMGFSLWGIALLPFIVGFKGFGIGVSAGYLFLNYGFKGILFYIAVLLPGIFLFSMVLIYQSAYSYNIFKKLYKSLFSKDEYKFLPSAKIYLQQSFKYLLITFLTAILDMALWWIFAGLFNF